jgi:hypothetical protein
MNGGLPTFGGGRPSRLALAGAKWESRLESFPGPGGSNMKFLTTVKPGPMPPPVDVARAAQEWLQAALDDGWIECCYAYPHGGGCSISEVDSHEVLMDRLLAYPMSPFVEYEVEPLVDLDAAFDRLIPAIERAAAGAEAGA